MVLDPTIPTQFANDPEVYAKFQLISADGLRIMHGSVPVRSGRLKRSLKSRVSRAGGMISVVLEAGGPEAPHWAFVEYGTGMRGAMSNQPVKGLPKGYHHGASPGMAAQPYMRSTLAKLRRKLR